MLILIHLPIYTYYYIIIIYDELWKHVFIENSADCCWLGLGKCREVLSKKTIFTSIDVKPRCNQNKVDFLLLPVEMGICKVL